MDNLMFGHTLRMLRTTAGVSLRTLAKIIDVSPSYLSQVELGKLPPPTHYRITKIAETIGIPVSLLIEMSHRPNPDVIMLLRGHHELNRLIKLINDIGLETKDIVEIIALMQKLGGSGFRKLMHYGLEHSSDFTKTERSNIYQQVSPYPINQMVLSELANPRLVFMRFDFTEKSDLLRYMIDKIGVIYSSFDPDKAYSKLMSNEAEDSSGLGYGVAIPHLFVDELDETVIAIARIPEGIDFNAIDKNPVYLVCMILSNPESYQSHLSLLAYFAQKFQLPTFMEEILKARSKKNILDMLFDGDDTSMHHEYL
jgi:mannitol/fructose-specific phosphotransferase system IIA component (Ntr-type)/transcriptional regulator with XRE-family HTH domain